MCRERERKRKVEKGGGREKEGEKKRKKLRWIEGEGGDSKAVTSLISARSVGAVCYIQCSTPNTSQTGLFSPHH